MSAPLRLAFLGVTHPHARAWADAAHENDETRIVTVHDPDAEAGERFASGYGAAACGSLEDALDGVDAVVVDGRNDEAAAFATAGIEHRLPTFIEKTGARTAAELADVASLAERMGVATQMGYFIRYSDAVVTAADAIARGRLGTISLARFHSAIPHQAWATMGSWFADSTNVVTPFMEAGCHLVDMVRHLLGEPTEPTATTVRWAGTPSPGEDAIGTTMRCGDAVITIDFTAHEALPWNISWGGEIFGTEATLRFGVTPARSSIRDSGSYELVPRAAVDLRDGEQVQAEMSRENTELMRRGMRAFVDVVRGRAASPVDARSGAQTLRLIEDVLAAARR